MVPYHEFNEYMNKHLLIKMESDAMYLGILSSIKSKQNKICLTKLGIINKNDGVTHSKTDTSREFNCNKIANFSVIEDYNDLCRMLRSF